MSYGFEIYTDTGELRLDLSSSLAHYLGTVTLTYSSSTSTRLAFTCPITYYGNKIVIVRDNLNSMFIPSGKYSVSNFLESTQDTLYLDIPNYSGGNIIGLGDSGTITCTFIGI